MLSLWFVRLAQAQAEPVSPPAPLPGEALVAEVWANSPAVAAAQAELLAATAMAASARARPDPMVEAMVAPGSFGSEHAAPGVTVTLSQAFAPPGAVSRAVDAAAARRDRAEAERDVVRAEVALEAVAGLFALWRLDQAIAATEAHEALLIELGQAARDRYAAGAGSLQDPIEAELEAVEIATERAMLRAERTALAAALNVLRGAAPDTPLVAAEPGPVPSLSVAVRPERRAADAGTEAAQAERRAVRAERGPELGLSGQYSSMWEMPEHRVMVGGATTVPLWGAGAARLDGADAEIVAARVAATSVALSLDAEAVVARAELDAADEVLALVRDRRVPLARERLAAARQAYVAGSADFPTVIDAARAQLEAELALADAVALRHTRAAAATRAEEAP